MRMITWLRRHWGKLNPDVKSDLAHLFDAGVGRFVIGEDFAKLAHSLRPTTDEELKSPEYVSPFHSFWIEWDDKRENSVAAIFVEWRFGQGQAEISVMGWESGRPVLYPHDGSPERLELTATAMADCLGMVRALNVVPDDFKEETTQPLGSVRERMEGPRRYLPDLTTIWLRNGRRESDGTISATNHRGQRFHFVRGHFWTPHTKTQPQWRRSHWRGDPSLGVTTPVYRA